MNRDLARNSDADFPEAPALWSEPLLQDADRDDSCELPPKILGVNESIKTTFMLMSRVAQCDGTSILIQGESGTGKEMVAKWIHAASSRCKNPFVAINCAAVPATLMENEFFGHAAGAYTDGGTPKMGLLEEADGGTLFLDEIGDMEAGMQAKLLRFLEDRTFRRVGDSRLISVNVRIISATNRDLFQAVQEHTFRSDLYYRLKVILFNLPPLRERKEDILLMAHHFIRMFNKRLNRNVKGLTERSEKLLLKYHWPGNVRELKNLIEREMVLGHGDLISIRQVPPLAHEHSSPPTTSMFQLPPEGVDLEEVEKDLLRQALESAEGNLTRAARKVFLGVDAFRYRIRKLGIV